MIKNDIDQFLAFCYEKTFWNKTFNIPPLKFLLAVSIYFKLYHTVILNSSLIADVQ